MPSRAHSLRFAVAALALAVGCQNDGSGSERVCKTIGEAGDTLSSKDGVLNISIRPSALSEDTEVCIAPDDDPPDVFGPAYRVTPDIDLAVNASITYRYDLPADTSQTAIGVILREEFEQGTGRWLSLPITRLEPDNRLVSGTDARLSMFYALLDDGGSGMVDPTLDPTNASATTESATTSDPTSDSTDADTDPVDTDSTTSSTGNDANPTDATASDTNDESSTTATTSESESESETDGFDCTNLPAAPFTIEGLGAVFPDGGAEDLAMTGNGTFLAASGVAILESDAEGNASPWFTPLPGANPLGLKVDAYGELIVAYGFLNPNIFSVSTESADPLIASGLGAPNGVFVDRSGNAWITDFNGGGIARLDPAGPSIEVVVDQNVNQANGVFFDEDRGVLFYTLYGPSQLWSVAIDADGNAGTPAMVTDLDGNSDGVTLDACGNAYVVDQGGGAQGANPCRIDRIFLDDDGNLGAGGVEEIAAANDLGNGCSNAQFGFGFGDSNDSALFVIGIAGDVYRIDVGVPGYAIALP